MEFKNKYGITESESIPNIFDNNNQSIMNTDGTVSKNTLDKSTLIIIILLCMFSSKLWDIAWDIGKSLLYIIIILYLINFVNTDLANNIRSIIYDFTNIDPSNNFISDLFTKILSMFIGIFNGKNNNLKKVINQVVQSVQSGQSGQSGQTIQSEKSLQPIKSEQSSTPIKKIEMFNYSILPNDNYNTKNFTNTQRNANKNIYH